MVQCEMINKPCFQNIDTNSIYFINRENGSFVIMYWTERFDSHLFPAEILKYAQIIGQSVLGNTANPYTKLMSNSYLAKFNFHTSVSK